MATDWAARYELVQLLRFILIYRRSGVCGLHVYRHSTLATSLSLPYSVKYALLANLYGWQQLAFASIIDHKITEF